MDDMSTHHTAGAVPDPRWKITYGNTTHLDGIYGWIFHMTRDGKPIYDHPWDDSYEAHICPECGGNPL